MYSNFLNILAFIAVTSFVTLAFSILCLRLTLDRRVRQEAIPVEWKYNSPYDEWWGLGLPRAILFGLCCIFSHVNNYDYNRLCYNEIDIKSFSNQTERAISWLMFLSCMTMLFFSFAGYLLEKILY